MKVLQHFLYLGLILLFSCADDSPPEAYLISNVNLVDVETGQVIPNQYVEIKGERISKIWDEQPNLDSKTEVIKGEGKYLIPGLWDMHTHYYWNYETSNPLLIANGVTGIREMFGSMDTIYQLKEKARKNPSFFLPEIVSSGPIIDGVPAYWPGSDTITDPNRATEIVSKQINDGVDFLKVYTGLSRECYFAIADEANKRGVSFAGHVPESISVFEAIEAKQKSVEHLYGVLESCSIDPSKVPPFKGLEYPYTQRIDYLLDTFDENKFDSLLMALANSETWICPTFTVLRATGEASNPTFVNDGRLKYLPHYMKAEWTWAKDFNKEYLSAERKQFSILQELLGKMHQAGVNIIAGTDYPNPYCYPGFSMHDELALMVESGLSPFEALQTATLNPAIFLGKEDSYGSIAEGKYASLVLLDKNPLDDIANTRSIGIVFLKGKVFNKKDLDKLLEEAERIAQQ